MLRSLLIFLSQNRWIKGFTLRFPLARKVARRFVAGETLDDALKVAQQLRSEGLGVALDLLGENVSRPGAAEEATAEYLRMLDRIQAAQVECYVSLKLTQLGLDESEDAALHHLETILEAAASRGIFVRIDMEGSDYTERTMNVFRRARARHDNVGIVIQAYLKRSRGDIEEINGMHGRVRLCKGAYAEPPALAYQARPDVTRNMVELMHELLRNGEHPAIASHDEEVISATLDTVRELGLSPQDFEFQMLYGIRRERQLQLRDLGYQVRIYVPFGSDWYPYFMRRLAERPANLVFFLTALFRG